LPRAIGKINGREGPGLLVEAESAGGYLRQIGRIGRVWLGWP